MPFSRRKVWFCVDAVDKSCALTGKRWHYEHDCSLFGSVPACVAFSSLISHSVHYIMEVPVVLNIHENWLWNAKTRLNHLMVHLLYSTAASVKP